MNSRIDTLKQLAMGPVWDGDLVSKTDRDCFVRAGWATRTDGWNIITEPGVRVAVVLGFLVA